MLKDVFAFAEHQEEATYGFGYKLTLKRNKDDGVIDKAAGTADARIKIDHIHWYVPHYTTSSQQQSTLFNQILSKTPTELSYVERSAFMKDVNNQNLWNFETSSQKIMNVCIWTIIVFQQQDRQNSQNLNSDTFCRLSVVSAQCVIGTEKYPNSSFLVKCDHDDYRQGYAQLKEAFRALTKYDIIQPYISDDKFRTSNVRADDIGYSLYVFDIRYQKNFRNSQPNKVEFIFIGVVPNNVNGYALVLTNKINTVRSDGNRHFDLIQVIINFFITLSFSFIDNSVFFSNVSLYFSSKLSRR